MKKILLLLAICFTVCINGAYAMCWISCDNSGHCWIIDDGGTPLNTTNWHWTLISGCPPGAPWVVQCLTTLTPTSDGNGGTTDGHGHTVDEATTQLIATSFVLNNTSAGPSQNDVVTIQNAILTGNTKKGYFDGTKYSPSVSTYFMQNNPAGYPQ